MASKIILLLIGLITLSSINTKILSSSLSKQMLNIALENGDENEAFKVWHFVNQKQYSLNSQEGERKLQIFKENLETIKKVNQLGKSYKLGLGPFSDLTNEEYNRIYVGGRKGNFSGMRSKEEFNKMKHTTQRKNQNRRKNRKLEASHYTSGTTLFDMYDEETDSFNYNKNSNNSHLSKIFDSKANTFNLEGLNSENKLDTYTSISHKEKMTAIRNQGQCGSCWAFSVAASLEYYLFGKIENQHLSTQQLVDCDSGSNGCYGGMFESPFDYVWMMGLNLEHNWKYVAQKQTCSSSKESNSFIIANDYEFCSNYSYYTSTKCSFERVIELLRIAPGSVGVDASSYDFQHYSEGILDNKCSYDNHAVVLVGYTNDEGKEYFTVRNSWGELWGDDGYFNVLRNDTNRSSCYLTNEIYIFTDVEIIGNDDNDDNNDDGDEENC